MSFLWPWMLLSLLALPLLIWLYGRTQARRRRLLARYAGNQPIETWQRHVPPALLMAGLAILAIALARPQMTLSLPRAQGTLILAFDVSGSMAADRGRPGRRAGPLRHPPPISPEVRLTCRSSGRGCCCRCWRCLC